MLSRPDVLVLGGGGVLGEAWMTGVLAGIEETSGFDLRRCEYFVGTSAGSIVAADLVAGRHPRRPRSIGTELEDAGEDGAAFAESSLRGAVQRLGALTLAAGATLAPTALGLATPAGALARAALLRGMPRPDRRLDDLREHIQQLDPRFDGRLRVTAVDRRSGRRVVFGTPGAPQASVPDAVVASCSVPWLFAPVLIGGREYVDGGVWSPTNLDAAPAGRGTCVLCLNPTASVTGAQTLLMAARNAARSVVSVEAMTLRRRGATVQMVAPDSESARAMGTDFMERELRGEVLRAGYAQGLRIGRGS